MRPHVYGTGPATVPRAGLRAVPRAGRLGVCRAGLLAGLLAGSLAGCGGAGEPAAPVPPPAPSAAGTPAAGTSAAGTSAAPAPVAEPHSLVFTVEGDAEIISIVYELDGVPSTEGPVSLPWRKTATVPADGRPHRWSLTLEHGSGQAELVAFLDGAVAGRTRGGGTGEGTLRVSGAVDG